MCQRLNTGESNNFYFGIFICIGSLTPEHELIHKKKSLHPLTKITIKVRMKGRMDGCMHKWVN